MTIRSVSGCQSLPSLASNDTCALEQCVQQHVGAGREVRGFSAFSFVVADAVFTRYEDHGRGRECGNIHRVVAGAADHVHVVVTKPGSASMVRSISTSSPSACAIDRMSRRISSSSRSSVEVSGWRQSTTKTAMPVRKQFYRLWRPGMSDSRGVPLLQKHIMQENGLAHEEDWTAEAGLGTYFRDRFNSSSTNTSRSLPKNIESPFT